MGSYRKFTGAEKSEIWDRIIAGETPASIALSMGRYPSAVRSLLLQTGGCARICGRTSQWAAALHGT